jgi:hypothetical protein
MEKTDIRIPADLKKDCVTVCPRQLQRADRLFADAYGVSLMDYFGQGLKREAGLSEKKLCYARLAWRGFCGG